jgi:WD40 repeat protein
VILGHSDSALALAVNDYHLFSGSQDGSIRVWNIESFSLDRCEEGRGNGVRTRGIGGNGSCEALTCCGNHRDGDGVKTRQPRLDLSAATAQGERVRGGGGQRAGAGGAEGVL